MTQQEYENKIKELQDELEKLKAAKIADSGKRWKPKENGKYWTVDVEGQVNNVSAYPDKIVEWDFLTGNCFKTKKEAEEYKKQIEYTARYKNYIEEHSEPIDWEDLKQFKYFARYDLDVGKITITSAIYYLNQGAIYASGEQIILDAIKEIGEGNFKKYVLGVK